ncbi:FadR/GntR family transcriptional regulator [Desulfotignum balticum]|uniref:FadR/GntR family transcriptional regulator n=1 Tax=Desulfotignum balticum TaxID=115781 RepID=UPI0004629F62|nr:FadR/GntR family transcriptional regulator [Desulfotignum balticum]
MQKSRTQIKSESAPEKIIKQIVKDIESGKLKPGDKLPNHQEMANYYGVGRSSIREAINVLIVMDLIVAMQGKGTFVKERTVKTEPVESGIYNIFKSASIYNLWEIREVLECYSVRKAAEVISEEQIVLLKEACERLAESYKKDHLYHLKEDNNFHMVIAQAAKNPELGEIIKEIHSIVNKKMSIILKTSSTGNIKKAINTSKNIVGFIISGDGSSAEREMREHLGIAKEAFIKSLLDEI